jgi:hypothetical protein
MRSMLNKSNECFNYFVFSVSGKSYAVERVNN